MISDRIFAAGIAEACVFAARLLRLARVDWQSMKYFTLLALAACLLSACRQSPPASKEPAKEYVLQGEVVRLDPSAHLATVNGQKIEGWMEAMTMEYPVRDPQVFAKLKVGEKIQGRVVVQGTDYWLAEVSETPDAPAPAPPSK